MGNAGQEGDAGEPGERPWPAVTPEGIDRVLSFLSLFESGDPNDLNREVPPEKRGNIWRMGYVVYSRRTAAFIQALYDEGLVVPYDWGAWQDHAIRYYEHPESLTEANFDTVRHAPHPARPQGPLR